MQSFTAPSQTLGTQSSDDATTLADSCSAVCGKAPTSTVSALLTERFEITDDELEQHIDDLAWSWRTAYARYEAHCIPADREEALMLLRLHNRAILARSPAAQAARWAEIDRAIDDGVNYFAAQGLQDRRAMEKGAG